MGLVLVLLIAAGAVTARAALTTAVSSTASAPSAAAGSGNLGSQANPVAPNSGTPSAAPPAPGAGGGSTGRGGSSSSAPTSWTQVASAVNPGVVNIETRIPQGSGAGTGMVLTSDGRVLTNNHVIEGATKIVVTVSTTGRTYSAQLVGADPRHDVAVLQMNGASGLATIPLGDSDAVAVGDQVAAIGNAGGQGGEPALASGRVTALDQEITASDQGGTNAERLTGMIQVAAEVVPGDSGGPLVDTSGHVIGMDTAASAGSPMGGAARGRTGGGVGFAIPINDALTIAKALGSGSGAPSSGSQTPGSSGSSSAPSGAFLGVEVQDSTSGVEIAGVQAGSPAAQAGLVAGDLVLGVDDTRVSTADELVSTLSAHRAGDQVTVTVVDGSGRTAQARVTLASR